MDFDYGIPEDPSLKTASSMRAWWLHTVWGYRIVEVRRKPRLGWFGQLRYNSIYRMLPPRLQ